MPADVDEPQGIQAGDEPGRLWQGCFLEDDERPLEELPGLIEPAQTAQNHAAIDEDSAEIRMVRTKCVFKDVLGTQEERIASRVSSLGKTELAQVVQRDRCLEMLPAQVAFPHGERASNRLFRVGIAPGKSVDGSQIVQDCGKIRWVSPVRFQNDFRPGVSRLGFGVATPHPV